MMGRFAARTALGAILAFGCVQSGAWAAQVNLCVPAAAGQAVTSNGAGTSCAAGGSAIALPASSADQQALIAILPHLSFSASGVGGKPTIRFTGVNVQVLSGAGATDAPVNGEGNLVIGYDASPGAQTGSHNLVLGLKQSYASYGAILGGGGNSVAAPYGATLGYGNSVNGPYAAITGGRLGHANGGYASVQGGYANTASGIYGSVTGGDMNVASGGGSSVAGGRANVASGQYSSITGGFQNTANAESASVTGGSSNTSAGPGSSITGGASNTTTGFGSTVAAGQFNVTFDDYSFIGAGCDNFTGSGSPGSQPCVSGEEAILGGRGTALGTAQGTFPPAP